MTHPSDDEIRAYLKSCIDECTDKEKFKLKPDRSAEFMYFIEILIAFICGFLLGILLTGQVPI